MEQLDSLSLEQKIGQLFFIGVSGTELDKKTCALLADVSPGGVCLFSRNIRAPQQTRKLLDDISEFLLTAPLLSIDQEGGLVDRLRRIMTPMPSASKLGTVDDASRLGNIIGQTLHILGFNMDFAPVVDVIDSERAGYSNGLHSRAFGTDKTQVVEFASAFLDSLEQNGIIGCLKHFPGLGASQIDSHEELPIVEISEDEFRSIDLYPYGQMLSSARAVMIAHACFPNSCLQENDKRGKLLPSSLSRNFITELLRGELGFDGLVITDDLEMGAIINNYGIEEACMMAINAGADMLAICADESRIRSGFNAVLSAVKSGALAEKRVDESLTRIAKTKSIMTRSVEFDVEKVGLLSSRIAELNSNLS